MPRLREVDAARRAAPAFDKDFSEAFARGLSIVAAFGASQRQATLSDLARIAGLPRATARRALHTLVALGYAESDGRLFRLTPRILELASAYLTSNPAAAVLQPACDRICREAGESCTVAVLDGTEATMIARALPAQLLPVGLGIGYRLPAFSSALGRVLLSALPAEALDPWLAGLEPMAQTPSTVIDKKPDSRGDSQSGGGGLCLCRSGSGIRLSFDRRPGPALRRKARRGSQHRRASRAGGAGANAG